MRNQCLNAPQETHQLNSGGYGLESNAHPRDSVVWGTPWLGDVAGREVMVKVCGVAVTMLQGHSWAPIPLNGLRMNVGTIPVVPPSRAASAIGGNVRRRLMLSGWGGGPVVVRAQESCVHGEGVQRVRNKVVSGGDRR